jgi:hypothetical protein
MPNPEKASAAPGEDNPERVNFSRMFARQNALELHEPPAREYLRGAIALVLLGMLIVELSFGATAAALHLMPFDQIKEYLALVIGPTVGLFGPISGFYFGSRQ